MAKKSITITLYCAQLYYDVKNKTYLTGRSRETGTNHEEVANMKANDDEEDQSQIMASLNNAVGVLKNKISEYTGEDVVEASSDKGMFLYADSATYVLTLKMPSNFNMSVTDTISVAAHQYVVYMATSEWFTITNKADSNDYSTLAAAQLEIIREAINKRVRPVRPTLTSGSDSQDTKSGS